MVGAEVPRLLSLVEPEKVTMEEPGRGRGAANNNKHSIIPTLDQGTRVPGYQGNTAGNVIITPALLQNSQTAAKPSVKDRKV